MNWDILFTTSYIEITGILFLIYVIKKQIEWYYIEKNKEKQKEIGLQLIEQIKIYREQTKKYEDELNLLKNSQPKQSTNNLLDMVQQLEIEIQKLKQ